MFPRRGSPLSGDNDGPVPESVAAVRDGRVTICYELNGVVFSAKGRPGTDVYCIWHGDFIDWFDGDISNLPPLIFHHLLEPSSNPWRPRERDEQCFFLCCGSAPNPERKVRPKHHGDLSIVGTPRHLRFMASSMGGSDLGLFSTCWDVVPIPGNDDFHWSGALRYGYQLVQNLGPAEKEGWSRADSSQTAIVNFDDRPAGAEVYPSQVRQHQCSTLSVQLAFLRLMISDSA
jgi:hypothetical protein